MREHHILYAIMTGTLVVDWFLDRFRTTVNVCGGATGTTIIERVMLKQKKIL